MKCLMMVIDDHQSSSSTNFSCLVPVYASIVVYPPVGLNLSINIDWHNVLIWREQLSSIINVFGLGWYVDVNQPYPSQILPFIMFLIHILKLWTRINETNKSWIYGSSVSDVLSHLPRVGAATQMWRALEKKFSGLDNRYEITTTNNSKR